MLLCRIDELGFDAFTVLIWVVGSEDEEIIFFYAPIFGLFVEVTGYSRCQQPDIFAWCQIENFGTHTMIAFLASRGTSAFRMALTNSVFTNGSSHERVPSLVCVAYLASMVRPLHEVLSFNAFLIKTVEVLSSGILGIVQRGFRK